MHRENDENLIELYTFYYNDGSYLSHELSLEQFIDLSNAIVRQTHAVLFYDKVLVLKDIRAVVKYEPPVEMEEDKGEVPDMSASEKDFFERMQEAAELFSDEEDEADYQPGGAF